MSTQNLKTCEIKIQESGWHNLVKPDDEFEIAGGRFHFIGAGGIGMSGLGRLLLKHKAIVTGSDQMESSVTAGLIRAGADIRIGHAESNLCSQTEAVVISAAVKEDNPELRLARKKGLKIYKYAQMLGKLMGYYEGIAVAGTHGKSTTSGWLVYLLRQAGFGANFIVGAEISQLAVSSGVGNSNYFVAEACEYDRSFLNLKPSIACVLNIEADHLDYYKDEDQIVEAFGEFIGGVRKGGVVIANGHDLNVRKVIEEYGNGDDVRIETFGFDTDCDFSAQNLKLQDGTYSFDLYYHGRSLGATRISLPGRHNILNALAAAAMAINAGIESEKVVDSLGSFTGIDRRLMVKEKINGVTVIDDYAHHPTEIRASLEAIRQRFEPARLWCIFQPHQHSRTRFLLDDFAESFKLADTTIVPRIYFVRDSEAERKEINSQALVEKISQQGVNAVFINDFGPVCDYLVENVGTGDVVVTMGAGDIWKVADEYIQRLRENS